MYREIVRSRSSELDDLIERGVFQPFFLHHYGLYAACLLLALAVPSHRSVVRNGAREAIFGFIFDLGLETIKTRRAMLGAGGYIVGLITAWWMIWSATLLVFNDAESDFQRIERAYPLSDSLVVTVTGNGRNCLAITDGHSHTRQNGMENVIPTLHQRVRAPRLSCGGSSDPGSITQAQETFYWQPYPAKLLHRLNWIVGLVFNMRGPEWNWRILTLDPLPRSVWLQLQKPDLRSDMASRDDAMHADARPCLRRTFFIFVKSYLALDALKVLMMRDPYFVGAALPLDVPPPGFPVQCATALPLLVRFYRLIFSAMGIYFALTFVTSFNPLVFLGVSTAFPNTALALTSCPLNAPWLYSDIFGPFRSSILDYGLAGCWDRWWHQLFRFGFISASRWLLPILPEKLARRRFICRLIHLGVAFSLSGLMHAAASYTQIADTKPSGPFLFFIVQVPGVISQEFLRRMLVTRGAPTNVQRTLNFAFVVAWFMLTGGLIADDLARGGVWLTEPIPVSPLRGLGFGAEDEGWLVWKEAWLRPYTSGRWWQSAVRIL